MSTIAGMLLRNIQRAPDQVAIEFEGIETTFHGYGERCFRLANALKKRGVRRLDRVAFLAMNTPETLEVYGACEVAGFITSTLNFRLAAAELLWIINDAAPCVLVFEAQYTATIDSIRPSLPTIAHYLCIGECPLWAEPYEAVLTASTITPPDAIPDAADPCLLMYTSGTTGRPKGVLRSQGGEANLAADMAAVLGTAGDSRLLIMMPMFHAGGRSMQLAVHWRAGTIVLHRRFDPIEVLQTIEQRKVTEMHLAPTLLQVILDTPGQENFDLSSIRTVMYAAAPMPVPLLRRGIERFGRVFMDGYGQTEGNGTALYKHQHYMEGTPEQIGRLGSVGQAALDGEIRIVDDADRDCPTGVPGEILIRNHSIMMGYWNNHPATVETLRGGWLHTGDIGRLDGQGFLFLVDRKKDMIISGGENVYCREVEEAIATFPGIVDTAVIGLPHPHWGEVVHAVIVAREGATVTEDVIIAHCRTMIAGYKCPKSISIVAELPRLPSGKINKVELRRQFRPVSA